MILDINGAPVKTIKDLLAGWKEFFEAKLNQDTASVAPNIADSFVEKYICNYERQ